MTNEYRHLEKGEIIQAGDEIDRCANPWHDDANWQPVHPNEVGGAAPDPQYPAHRQFRRLIMSHLSDAWRSAQWEKKVWGEVLHLFASDSAAVSYLRVNAGYRCSKHHHEHRANQFTVISGGVVVKYVMDDERDDIRQHELWSGASFTILSGIVHWFEVIESGEMVEVYWADRGGKVSIDDIVRQDEGGPIDGCST